jgi:hypothetical protein
MASEFDFGISLDLDRAKLVSNTRENDLGASELVLDYRIQNSGAKQEAREWLEANRLQMLDPTFSFKTYTGTWNCITIEFTEDAHIIRQTFKIDVSVGDLGDVGQEPDYGLQVGDLVRISDGMEMFRAYYWKVSNPEDIDLPPADIVGEIWTKTANDNGDGTFDVVVSKEVAQSQTANNEAKAGDDDGNDFPGAYDETTLVNTNDSQQRFVSAGGSVPNATTGQIKRIENAPLENGKFRTTITLRQAIPQRIPPDSEAGGPNYPWLEYGSDFIQDANNIIIGRNQTWANFIADRDRTNISPAIFKINSISVRVNDYGLFDYTIISNTPG